MNNENTLARRFGVTSIALLVLFLVWATLVATGQNIITVFDKSLINLISNTNEANLAFARTITVIGNTKTMTWLTILVTIILLLFKKYPLALYFAGTMALANLTNSIIKNIIQRPRPTVTHLVHAGGYSFPSGHSIGSMTFFVLLIILSSILFKNKTLQTIITIVCSVMPLLIGYSRIYLHVHFPSDVFGGFLLALTFITASLYLYHRYQKFFKRVPNPS